MAAEREKTFNDVKDEYEQHRMVLKSILLQNQIKGNLTLTLTWPNKNPPKHKCQLQGKC